MARTERVEVVVVGGGPAGAVTAARIARAGRDVVLLERSPAWRWRALGVFASPATVTALAGAGLDDATLRLATTPVPAMRVETPAGTAFRLTYGTERGGEPAVGFDRSRLDPALVDLARSAGVDVRVGASVTAVALSPATVRARDATGEVELRADVVVGADGRRSIVAAAAGVARRAWLSPRLGLTFHLAEPDVGPDAPARDARIRVIRDGYVGLAPVPGGRVNVGIVLGRSWHALVAREGAWPVARRIIGEIPPADVLDPALWRHREPLDHVAGAWPVGHRVTRRAGRGWLLVGDAAGFLDPFTGEGLHRAIVSAELAAAAVDAWLRGQRRALDAYDRTMSRRFAAKDAISWLVQAFLARPTAFEYAARRVASRPSVRATMGLVMGDLVPATRGLDPRYLAALLAP